MSVIETHLSDLRHRVANDLALIVSVLARQRRVTDFLTADEIIDDAIGAILAVAQLYRTLHRTSDGETFIDLPDHIADLASALRVAYLDRLGIDLVCACDAVATPSEVARDIGMIITELVSNAAKHAFGSGAGQVLLHLSDEARGLVCRVEDNGCGVSPDAVLRTGGGLTSASRLATHLGGWVEVQRRTQGGLAFDLIIPRIA